jgi:maltooligosyltrehalose trehalohydrolase
MTPLLFMGQEWAATSPFQYFTDHEPDLGHLVSDGRREEFKRFAAFADPAKRSVIPDPQSASTFERSRVHWSERDTDTHRRVLELYRQAIAFRRDDPVMRDRSSANLTVKTIGNVLAVRRSGPSGTRLLVANLGATPARLSTLPWSVQPGDVLITSRADAIEESTLAPSAAVILAQDANACP